MRRKLLFRAVSLLSMTLAALFALASLRNSQTVALAAPDKITQGSLQVIDPQGKVRGVCPLKHTDVKAEISGFLSRVRVTQEFENPFKDKIEAVYTFPLPQAAAVDDMTMQVGERTVRGKILRREQAQAVYEAAKTNGQVASLLDQERPNIFTQSVANIMPGEKVTIIISYVETLKYEDGTYEFSFPMVVGPRYVPGKPAREKGAGFSPDTDKVPDASRITPEPLPAGMRAGHDISLDVTLDAGVPVDGLKSSSHEVEVEKGDISHAHVRLKNMNEIPNKDFVLKYDVAGQRIEDALLAHRTTDRGGYFTLILQPPERVTAEDVMPKELVFVLDTSGSMEGFPIEKAKETMKLALDGLYPQDTFNLITFAGDTHILFDKPVPATKENLRKAQAFLSSREGHGGTEMMKAIRAALDPSDAQDHVRIVCFMTDGYVGDDMEIIGEVQKHANARVFSFGIGSSVNHFLLDKMAEYGRGEVEYVSLNDDGSAAARRFHERVRNPLLTDISVDWAGLPVSDVYPQQIPDLFSAKPVILSGRYTQGATGTIRLKGKMSGRDFVKEIPVQLPEAQAQHDVLASLWARRRIDNLMGQDMSGMQQGNMKPELQETITRLGLEYRLMTQFTSFVAVEEMTVTDGGKPRRVDVPIELPEGVNGSSVLKEKEKSGFVGQFSLGRRASRPAILPNSPPTVTVSASVVNSPTEKSKRQVAGQGQGQGGGIGPGRGGAAKGNANASTGKLPQGSLSTTQVVAGSENTMILDNDERKAFNKLSPDDEKRLQLQTKLQPSLVAIVDRLKDKSAKPGADEAKFVHDGKAEIQIWLTEKSPEVLERLKQLGFEVILDPKSVKMLIGRVPLEKLAALAEIKEVRYVAPQISD